MKRLTNVAQILVRITDAIQVILGIIIWFGVADAFIPVHILSGVVLVVCFWILAIMAVRAGANLGFVVFALVWGLLAAVLGLIHEGLIPGQAHWIIQVIHLLVGLAVLGIAERLGRQIKHK